MKEREAIFKKDTFVTLTNYFSSKYDDQMLASSSLKIMGGTHSEIPFGISTHSGKSTDVL